MVKTIPSFELPAMPRTATRCRARPSHALPCTTRLRRDLPCLSEPTGETFCWIKSAITTLKTQFQEPSALLHFQRPPIIAPSSTSATVFQKPFHFKISSRIKM